ncbi:MAG TPA: MBOAT family O-acyltransferase [Acidobacteriaceae bacterium]|nr:MBOAT family O-acyltransferase [Acidobacteriaceae bacterium]
MLFNSFQFFFFFIVVWLLMLVTRGTPRRVILLLASYYFYMCWSTKYIFVIWGITLIDYFAGLKIEESSGSRRRLYLALSLFCNIGLLVFFKYFNFLVGSASEAAHLFGLAYNPPLLSIILPVGLSFHTFQAMSYTIEVYRGKAPAERSLLRYALYVAFFPQMVAGPIERPNQLLPQFHHEPRITLEAVSSGLVQALWGLFKKIVIADNVSDFVKLIYGAPRHFNGAELLLATTLFSLQIYGDFSGYTDIALGLARTMGFELVVNFRQPYFSSSVGEFWHRWHISLSTWFRDYVYIPMGGSRVSLLRNWFNLMVTFVVSGLWHGANWTFVAWGFLHGLYLIVARTVGPYAQRVGRALGLERTPRLVAAAKILFTFCLVTLAWIYFRARTVGDAWYITWHLLPLGRLDPFVLKVGGFTRATAPFLAFSILAMLVVEWWIAHPLEAPSAWKSPVIRALCYNLCIYAIVFFGFFGHRDFIYFQF